MLIEDDLVDSAIYTDISKTRTDIEFVAMTNSCKDAIEYVKLMVPEGIILDLQLIDGEGSGLQFLELLATIPLTIVPIVVVTTSNKSKTVSQRLDDLGADWYFSKLSKEYSHRLVIDTLVSLRTTINYKQRKPMTYEEYCASRNLIETPQDRNERILHRVDVELNVLGIRSRLAGRDYLRDAIFFLVTHPYERGSGIEIVAAKNKRAYSSTLKSMQTALNDTWKNGDPENLVKHFSSRISIKDNAPHATDFIHYYVKKISESI